MSRVSLDDDFSKIFRTIERRDLVVRRLEGMYLDGKLPFASLSALLGRSVPEVWSACTAGAFVPIRIGTGTNSVDIEIGELLREADIVILDLVALLTVHELGLAEKLHARFPRIAVPQLVIDELQNLHAATVMGPPSIKWLGKNADGQYGLTEAPDEFWNAWKKSVESLLKLAESLERISTYRLLELDGIEALMDALTPPGLGALFASEREPANRPVLVSDDLGLSGVGRMFGINSANSQDVLETLRICGILTESEYSESVERLILMNYWFIGIRAEDIVRRLDAHGYMTTPGTRAMLKTLEGPDCSDDSAITVATEVVAQLVMRVPAGEINVITSLLVETLKRGRGISPILLKFRSAVRSRLASSTYAQAMVLKTIDLHISYDVQES